MAGEGGINEMYPGLKKDYSEKTEAVRKELVKKKGIILRSTETGYHIKNKLRLTIGSSKENLKFMSIVKTMFN